MKTNRTWWAMAAVVAATGCVGCVSDPRDPGTWIGKLNDPREQQEAIVQLQRINDPVAVGPLITLYKKTRDPEHLRAVAHFKSKEAVPVLVDALDYSSDSCEAAKIAANALGDVPDPSAVDPLIKTLSKPLPIKTACNIVKLEAMKSLVKIHDARAVDALVSVLSTSADDQDFFLNNVAAQSLGEFGDARAVPALVRGLFMTGRGSDIFQPCRLSLLQIGKASGPPLVEAMQGKNAKLNDDAKKNEFRPGVIVQKTALVLGDLRDKDALPALEAALAQPPQGSSHNGILYAIGMIGSPSTIKDLTGTLANAKLPAPVRVAAAEGLGLAGDPLSLPTLLTVARSEKADDVRGSAALAYSRVGGAGDAAAFLPIAKAEKVEKDLFAECAQRLDVSKACGKDLACYGKELDDPVLAKQEKAAFMLAQLGTGAPATALPFLAKKVSSREPIVRIATLFAIGKLGTKNDDVVKKALDAQIENDRTKPPLRQLVDEMRATLAMVNSR